MDKKKLDKFIGITAAILDTDLWKQDVLTAERDKYEANDVKPDLTVWAQINRWDELEIPDKAKLDGEYVKKLSTMIDAKVFLGSLNVFGKDDILLRAVTEK